MCVGKYFFGSIKFSKFNFLTLIFIFGYFDQIIDMTYDKSVIFDVTSAFFGNTLAFYQNSRKLKFCNKTKI